MEKNNKIKNNKYKSDINAINTYENSEIEPEDCKII